MAWDMMVTSRLRMEDPRILPCRAARAGANRSLDQGTTTPLFDNVKVPPENLVGLEGKG
jgi:hypothetical protein